MTTPEGKVKAEIRKILREQWVYFLMPVQMGYGAAGLDFHCIVLTKTGYPLPFFIEAKKPGGETTDRQDDLIARLRERFRCKVWIIDNVIDVRALELWLQKVRGV